STAALGGRFRGKPPASSRRRGPCCSRVGSTPRTWRMPSPRSDHSASTRPRGSRRLPASRTWNACGGSSPRCGRVMTPSPEAARASDGRFGPYGGRFVPETLIHALDELERAYADARADAGFRAELAAALRDFAGRPTPLVEMQRLSEAAG